MSLVGLRVLRGPDWCHGELDGGDGHIGTIVNIGGLNTADVVWDNGNQCLCRIGENGKQDLKIYDSGPVGICHSEFACSSCSECGLFGIRWQCSQCSDVNLCSVCYVTDKHDINHSFLRFDTPQSQGTLVPKRASSLRCHSSGMFVGAIVKRGRDWNYDNQDGGSGKNGKVIGIEDAGLSTARNILRVKWKSTGQTHSYRLGGTDGKVDLMFVEQSRGSWYYPDHLPVCEKNKKQKCPTQNFAHSGFEKGDQVCIKVSSEDLRTIQGEKSQFQLGMTRCIGQIGEVLDLFNNEDISVKFDGGVFHFLAEVLIRVPRFGVGDMVRIIGDLDELKILQENHGEYESDMKKFLGQVGQVIKKDSDGDVIVKVGHRTFLFNPACCIPAPGETVDQRHTEEATSKPSGKIFSDARPSVSPMEMVALFHSINDDNLNMVQQLLDANPELVEAPCLNITPLTLASNNGNRGIVLELLERGADINKINQRGHTPLMAAIEGNRHAIVKLLIQKGADVKTTTEDGHTALHYAVQVDDVELIELLLQKGCELNKQDEAGQTPLHIAAARNTNKVLSLLCKQPNIKIEMKTNLGFNAVHYACTFGNMRAVDMILERNRNLLTSDCNGLTPLHFSVKNHNLECCKLLIEKYKADVNCQTNDCDTPLSLAVLELNIDLVKYLLEKNADANIAESRFKLTPLHVCFLKSGETGIKLQIAKCLLDNGASTAQRDIEGLTAVERCTDAIMFVSLIGMIRHRKSTQAEKKKGLETLADRMHLPCTKCFKRPNEAILLPCLHKCLCEECCRETRVCTLCNRFIKETVLQKNCWTGW